MRLFTLIVAILSMSCADFGTEFDEASRVVAVTVSNPSPAAGSAIIVEALIVYPEDEKVDATVDMSLLPPLKDVIALEDATSDSIPPLNKRAVVVKRRLPIPTTAQLAAFPELKGKDLPVLFALSRKGKPDLNFQKMLRIDGTNKNPEITAIKPSAPIAIAKTKEKEDVAVAITLEDPSAKTADLLVRWQPTYGSMELASVPSTVWKIKDEDRDRPKDGKVFIYAVATDKRGGEVWREVAIQLEK